MKNLIVTAGLTVIISMGTTSCGKKAQESHSSPPENIIDQVELDTMEETHRDLLDAIVKGDVNRVKIILSFQKQVDLNKILSNDETLLTTAVINDQTEIVQILMKDANVSRTNSKQETPLMVAARLGKLGLVKLLALKSKTDLQDTNGNTALHLAIISEHEEVALYLINNNANYDITNKLHMTPLKLAMGLEMTEVVSLLQARTLSSFERPDLASVEVLLLKSSTENIAQIFAKHPGIPKQFNQINMLSLVIKNRIHDDVLSLIDILLANGALIDSVEETKESTLMVAVDRDFLDIVRILLKEGANPNIILGGETALTRAVKGNSPLIVQTLLNRGAWDKFSFMQNGKNKVVKLCDVARAERPRALTKDQKDNLEEIMQYLGCGLRGFF